MSRENTLTNKAGMAPVQNKKFVIIDGCSMLFRAYYAIPQLLAHDNTPVGAIYGFIKAFRSLLKIPEIKGKHEQFSLAVALDTGNKKANFRYQLYNAYKGNRKTTPQELVSQLKLTRYMLDAFGIKCLSDESGEADDVIATYTRIAKADGYKTVIISGDKDLMQLMSEEIAFYDLTKKRMCSEKDIHDKFGVAPHQILDYLSIVGDKSDNIPGVRGIGKKSAAELLQQFRNIEGVYNNIDKVLTPRVRNALIQGHDSAFLSKQLVQLKDTLDVNHQISELAWSGFKTYEETIREFLIRYSLESLIGIVK